MFLLSVLFGGILGGTTLFNKKKNFQADVKLFKSYLVKAQQAAMGYGGTLILQMQPLKNETQVSLTSAHFSTDTQKFPSLHLKAVTSIFFEAKDPTQSLLIFDQEPGVFPRGTFTLIGERDKAFVTLPLKESVYDPPPLPS